MKISPFWSFHLKDRTVHIKNSITKRKKVVDAALLDTLEDIYRTGETPSSSTGLRYVEEARQLHILFSSVEEEASWLNAWEQSAFRPHPLIDQIELTNICPYTCDYCPRTTRMTRPLGQMTLNLFHRTIQEAVAHQDYVGLHHFGESLTHPRVSEIIALAHEHGLMSGLSANPPTLSPKLGVRLLEAGVTNLVLSLDSLDSGTYASLRGTAAKLEKAKRNIAALVDMRSRMCADVFISLQMISMEANRCESQRFIDYCREVGVDYGVIVRFGLWDKKEDEVKNLGYFSSPGYQPYCRRPWESVVMLWDGRVVPCCHDFNGAVIFGRIDEKDLSQIWNDSVARSFREQNQLVQLCRSCAFSRWSRDNLRRKRGFWSFHQDVEEGYERLEWLNPNRKVTESGERWRDQFDVMTMPSPLTANRFFQTTG